MNLYEQGDLIEMDFSPSVGHEPAKVRPAVVVSVGYFNNIASSLTVVCPITSTVNGHPLHIELPAACPVHGCICIEQMRTVDLGRRFRSSFGERLDAETMSTVLNEIGAVFGI